MTSLIENQEILLYHPSFACPLSSTSNYFTTPIGLCKTFPNDADFTECPIYHIPEDYSLTHMQLVSVGISGDSRIAHGRYILVRLVGDYKLGTVKKKLLWPVSRY